MLAFALLGCAMLGAAGIISSLWAESYDQMSAVQNFIIVPLTFLSGVFYSIHSLPPFWQGVSRFNPFFYLIDGFRYGFFGVSDVEPGFGLSIVAACFLALSWATLLLLKSGYKLRK
jgi:ABC-2 type transport system permease protein